MKTHTTSKAVNLELNAFQQNNVNRCLKPKNTDKNKKDIVIYIFAAGILGVVPALVITLNYFGLIHNI